MISVIKTITFDFGGVLYSYDSRPLMIAIANNSTASVTEIVDKLSESQLDRAHFCGELKTSELLNLLQDEIGLSMTEEELADTYARCVSPNEGLFQLVETLYPNYNLQLFSDTPKILYDHVMTEMPIFEYFSALTLSFEIGRLKDSLDGYYDMISKSCHSPEEIVFIDDKEEYTNTATELGVNGITYSDTEKLRNELKQLEVKLS